MKNQAWQRHSPCSVTGCDRLVWSRDWCQSHYDRWKRYGDPLGQGKYVHRPPGLSKEEVFQWFMKGDPPESGCWDWPGRTRSGYGSFDFRLDGRKTTISAHVVAHEIFNANDPLTQEKPFVLHDCDRPICVQPAHLHAGSNDDNMREMKERGRSTSGEKHPAAKLTAAQALWVRQQVDKTLEEMAQELGVSFSQIGNIRRGSRWTSV